MPQYQNFGSTYPTNAGYSLTIGRDGSFTPQGYYQTNTSPQRVPTNYYSDVNIQPPQSSLSQFDQYNLEQQAKQQELLNQLAIQQGLVITNQPQPQTRAQVQQSVPEQPAKEALIPEDSLKAIEATGQASSGFVDNILEAFGDDISPENKQKAEEIKTTFTNLASRLAGFAERLQGIAEKVPQLTQLLSLQQAASKKGISFEATKDTSSDKVLSFA